VIGVCSDGQQRRLGQVLTAVFADESQLHAEAPGLFVGTPESGEASFDVPEAPGRADVLASIRATSVVAIACNLDAAETIRPAWDPHNTDATSSFAHSLYVYDSLGQYHDLTNFYRKAGDNVWEWHTMLWETQQPVGSGTLRFDASGHLIEETSSEIWLDFDNAAPSQMVSFDFGTRGSTIGGVSSGPTTQYPYKTAQVDLRQDGDSGGPGSGIVMSGDALPMSR
jgi:flagellar hook protein FlgE